MLDWVLVVFTDTPGDEDGFACFCPNDAIIFAGFFGVERFSVDCCICFDSCSWRNGLNVGLCGVDGRHNVFVAWDVWLEMSVPSCLTILSKDVNATVEQSWLRWSWVVEVAAPPMGCDGGLIGRFVDSTVDGTKTIVFSSKLLFLSIVCSVIFWTVSTTASVDLVHEDKGTCGVDNILESDVLSVFSDIVSTLTTDMVSIETKEDPVPWYVVGTEELASCFCISQLHRVHNGGGSSGAVVGVGGITSITAGGTIGGGSE